MSFYTEQVKTQLIDPTNDITNRRTEFRLLENTFYLSNLRLANLGATSDKTEPYNGLVGALSVIKKISLMDGNQLIDTIDNFNILQGFRNYNKSNEKNKGVNSVLTQDSMGFKLVTSSDGLTNPQITTEAIIENLTPSNTTTPTSWLYLNDVFPVLNQLQFIHTGLFKKFRVVLEYTNDYVMVQPSGSGANLNTVQPLLIADELQNPEQANEYLKNFKGVQYVSTENDRFTLPGVTSGIGTQNVNLKVQGYNNKTLTRLLMVKTPPQGYSYTYISNADSGKASSVALANEKFQLRVNGKNLLPRDGMIGPNERLGMLHDIFGQCNTLPGSNVVSLQNSGNYYNDDDVSYVGALDYTGVGVNEKIKDLQLNLTRSTVENTLNPLDNAVNNAYDINLFGEVVKVLTVNNGGYNVTYA